MTERVKEKPIGEIIGWVPCGPHGWQPPDVASSDGSPPGCDDMLAWLNKELDHVHLEAYPDGDDAWDVYVHHGVGGRQFYGACLPSLREALEDIVRQHATVAALSREDPKP